jgi:hypothetical protein
MKTTKLKLLGLVVSLFIQGLVFGQTTPVAKNGQLKVCGLKLCNQYGNAIQLRGMSTHGIQWYGWGSCLTAASLDALAYDWGSDVLRISLYVQEGGYETNPAGFTAQVNTLIEEATKRGMYALVDWHQLTPGDPNANLANAKKFFTDIANVHKNKNNIIYDICNEPNEVAWSRIKTYADQIIPVIRAIDSDAVVLIGTHGWGSMGISDGRTAQDIVSLPVNFPNIMYTFHFYAASHGDRYLQELDWASDRLPVFVTEFGTQTASGDGTNNFTMSQKYIDLMRNKKISWTNWNYSDDNRTGAVWTSGTCSNGPWTVARLKPAGVWIRERMLSPADDFPGGGTNVLPSVSITSPANNASYQTGAVVSINANATDSDGSISKVDFFVDGALIGSDVSSPYSINWTATLGTHSLTAKATDDKAGVSTSSSVSVTVTNPVTQSPYGGTVRPIPGIIEAEHYDLGGQNVAFNDLSAGNSGTAFRTENVDIEASTDIGLGYNVGWVQAGEWLEYTINVTQAGIYKLEARVAATAAGKTFRVELDGQNISGSLVVPNTGNWQNWQTVTATTPSLTTGQKIMRIFMESGDFNLNHVTFSSSVSNNAPQVTITSPSNGASFSEGTAITINANASDNDGSVSKVEFFRGTVKIGEDLTSPFSINWTGATAGTYALTAKATDDKNATTTSGAVSVTVTGIPNSSPTVSLTSPSNNASFSEGSSITLSADAADSDGSVSKVEFYRGTVKIGEDLTTPYSINWTGATAGTYSLTAVATDNRSASTTSSAVSITVTGIPNSAPTASLTAPTNNASFNEGASITLSANAADTDGTISKVEFFRGTTKIGEDLTSPYSISWTGATAGTYSLTAKATDNKGATGTSSAISVTVKANTNTCSGTATYVENGGYTEGSKVQNAGSLYQCKPWPYSGWCNGGSWAYAPGTGLYWSDAWTLVGACTATTAAAKVSGETYLVNNAPNPFEGTTTLTIQVEQSGETSLVIYDNFGKQVAVLANEYMTAGSYSYTLDGSLMKTGIYVCKLVNNGKVTNRTISKQ